MSKPTALQRIPTFQRPPTLGRGQAYRTLDARPHEDRDEALRRAARERPWGTRIVAISRTGDAWWTCTIRETHEERRERLRMLAERRAAS